MNDDLEVQIAMILRKYKLMQSDYKQMRQALRKIRDVARYAIMPQTCHTKKIEDICNEVLGDE